MNASPRRVTCDADNLWIELADGPTLGVPLAWFPRLLAATAEERSRVDLSPRGIHWNDLDEDISIDGLLQGEGDLTQRPRNSQGGLRRTPGIDPAESARVVGLS